MGIKIDLLLDLANVICEIAFIGYAWITMLRINTYIKGQESKEK